MERCWKQIPSRRIVEDILDFERILTKIVELKGAILTDQAKCSGRRREPAKENSLELKNKTRNRQRIAAMMVSEAPFLEELHDAYIHWSGEQLDLFEVGMEEAIHEHENEQGDEKDNNGDVVGADGVV